MEWTEQDKQRLLAWRDKIDNEDLFVKEKIKKILINNKDIIHVLNNKQLEESGANPDDYYYVNIFPYHIIYPTQTNVQNFICFETSFEKIFRGNQIYKFSQIIFTIMCEQKNVRDTETGLTRHDLLASLLLEQFNYSNFFGTQIQCVSNKPGVSDNSYANRVLIFQNETTANILRTEQRTRVINNEVRDGI